MVGGPLLLVLRLEGEVVGEGVRKVSSDVPGASSVGRSSGRREEGRTLEGHAGLWPSRRGVVGGVAGGGARGNREVVALVSLAGGSRSGRGGPRTAALHLGH